VSTSISVVDSATRESTLQWLALTLTPGLGPTRAHRLVEHFGTVAAVFRASLTELEATGLLAVSAQSLGTGRSLELAQEEAARAAAAGVHLVSIEDAAYPARLKQIYDPPIVLYVRGAIDILAQPGIAVVGTRHPTPYGSGMAERLSIDLATRGLVIQSGMAAESTRRRIVERLTQRARRSPFSARASMFRTRRRTRAYRSRSSRSAAR
jgi:DNA processing protein